MAGLFQGDPLPDVVKTIEQQQVAPEFYTNYLQDIANLGQNAVTQGGVAGFSPLQQQALQMAPNLAFSGSGSLGAASQIIGQAGTTTAPDVVQNYMNPYTKNVVDEMGRLQSRNIRENVLPNIGGAAIGTGGFGSRRQGQITGQVLRDLQSDLVGKQYGALQQGYSDATKSAQNDLERALNAGRSFTSLGQEQRELGTGGLKTLFDLGAQEQALGQKQLDYPMAQTQAYSKLLQGYQVPTGQVQQTTGPGDAGSYSNSPLSQIATLLAGLGAFMRPASGQKDGGAIRMKNGGKVPMAATHRGQGKRMKRGGYAEGGDATPIAYTDGNGNIYDTDGNLVE
jgi:hypothetical protein